MSASSPLPHPGLGDFAARCRAHDRLAAELLLANKAVLLAALGEAGITSVTLVFDGYGDSGQIEAVFAKAGDEDVELPATLVEIGRADWTSSESERLVQPLRGAVETFAYSLVAGTHSGWENGEGAFGEVVFDVAGRAIRLDYNERLMTSENHSHRF